MRGKGDHILEPLFCPRSGDEVLGLRPGPSRVMTAGKKFKRLVRERARRTGESYASARRELLRKRSEDEMNDGEANPEQQLVEVTATEIRMKEGADGSPFLVLEDAANRQLPVAIGSHEATSIAFALQGVEVKRPMTHDALKQTVEALGAEVPRVVVGFLPEPGTFTADVVLRMADGVERHLDWRLSDAVALVVRYDPAPPVLVPERLLASPPGALMGPWPRGARVRCSCGQWMPIEEFTVVEPGSSGADDIEADVTCPSCGGRRHVRLRAPGR